MGSAYAAMFSAVPDFTVNFVARGARCERLNRQPPIVSGKPLAVPAPVNAAVFHRIRVIEDHSSIRKDFK